jgi:hypothetical protein
MCSNRWEEIDFSIVPSCAMNRLKKAFQKHTPEKFADWLNAVKEGKSKINAGQLQPHEIAKYYINGGEYDEVVELQWQQIVENTSKLGNFEDSIVLSDVSGSMDGVPMEVSIALGILISSLTAEPFKNTVISFDTNPTMHIIPDTYTTLQQKVNSMKEVPWGGTTDLYKVFELILNRAKQYGLSPDQMPKRLYILSDMQFDSAIECDTKTVFESIEDMYSKTIYTRPDIIFWNLRSDTTNDFTVHIGGQAIDVPIKNGHLSHFRQIYNLHWGESSIYSIYELKFDFNYYNCYFKPIIKEFGFDFKEF